MNKRVVVLSIIILIAIFAVFLFREFKTAEVISEIQELDKEEILPKPNYSASNLELKIHNAINQQRKLNNLSILNFDDNISMVARLHSLDQALNNLELTNLDLLCPLPHIRHEGFRWGIYQRERLNYFGVNYFSMSGENIIAEPLTKNLAYRSKEPLNCNPIKVNNITSTNETVEEKISRVKSEIDLLINESKKMPKVNWTRKEWKSEDELVSEIISSWMNSTLHRKNILTKDFTSSGVGISSVNDYLIITQVFIKKVDCGYLNGNCCRTRGYYPWCYQPYRCYRSYCIR